MNVTKLWKRFAIQFMRQNAPRTQPKSVKPFPDVNAMKFKFWKNVIPLMNEFATLFMYKNAPPRTVKNVQLSMKINVLYNMKIFVRQNMWMNVMRFQQIQAPIHLISIIFNPPMFNIEHYVLKFQRQNVSDNHVRNVKRFQD